MRAALWLFRFAVVPPSTGPEPAPTPLPTTIISAPLAPVLRRRHMPKSAIACATDAVVLAVPPDVEVEADGRGSCVCWSGARAFQYVGKV